MGGNWSGRWLVLLLALVACGKKAPAQQQVTARPSAAAATLPAVGSATPPATPSAAPSASGPLETPQQLLTEWTRALNAQDLASLERLYADRVRFYGQSLTRGQVMASKRKALAATPTFTQSVLDTPTVHPEGQSLRVTFHKRSGTKASQHDVLATLLLSNGASMQIQEESDAATDKRFRAKQTAPDAPDNCELAVWFLADSTKEVQRLYALIEKNLHAVPESAGLHGGGMGPFLPSETGDDTYQLSIGVSHPERFEAYGWVNVTPKGQVTMSAYPLELDEAQVQPSPEALQHFQRLCTPR